MTLKQKTISGILWTSLAKMSMQVVLFIVTVVLARLLTPDDFGLLGMAAVITVAISIVNDRGLGTVIVQKRTLPDALLSTVFWGGLFFGFALFLLSIFASYPLTGFFKKSEVQQIVIVQGMGFIIGAFGIVQKSLLTREMNFKKLSIMEVASIIASGLVSVSMALLGFGVWSLVIGNLVRDGVGVILVWIFSPWRPRRHFSWSEFKELFAFSANVLGNDVAFYLNTNADITIVGKVLGASALGYYTLALNLVKLPVTRLSGIVSKVTFPAFSSVQNDLETFKRGYAKSMSYISIITFPILVGLGLFAREFILLFFKEKWLDMVAPLIILVPMAMLKSVGTIRGSVLMARGKPQIEFWWNAAYLIPLALAVYAGAQFGLIGVSIAFSGLYLLTFPIIQKITDNQVNLPYKEFFDSIRPATISSILMVAGGLLFKYAAASFLSLNTLLVFIIGVILTTAIYLGSLWLFSKSLITEIVQMITMHTNSHRQQKRARLDNPEVIADL
jgi:O-antigen/teichoic acid export membrane protein